MASAGEPSTDVGRGLVRRARLLPVVLLIGGGLLDVLTPRQFSATAFYSIAPIIAAPLMSLTGTVLTGIAACAVDAAVLTRFGYLPHELEGGLTELASIAAVAIMAVVINRVLYRRDVRLRSARGIATVVQSAVLPRPRSRIGPFRIAVRYEAALKEAQIGGDLYAVQRTGQGLRCIIGDVRGKGLGAVEAVSVVLGAFREAAHDEPTLDGVWRRLERTLARELESRPSLDRIEGFITALLAEIAPSGDQVRLVNRGHPAPLVLLPDGVIRAAEPSRSALPLGLAVLDADPDRVAVDAVPFPEGATLLLYTDGVTEARDRAGVFYDPVTALAGRRFAGPDAVLNAVVDDVHRHTGSGGADDDMALLAVTVTRGDGGVYGDVREPRTAS
ncbi:PP2C family protein-serine/threonine phosphatase [Streptomyces jeddahensis]|uniref:Stage II sporulation protein E (SpoIIE) n=1 Tax=Streptomyces jeddahensis TaxID=1716141 RepID=A0A177HS51_9ACTN|nr:PP2C family protein-serine/threonine phosphatase [Streptomyces jeddahensis]OAH13014.1 stage II sporulation protein E (SpoIIE) [Streptomyces jeddahensis]